MKHLARGNLPRGKLEIGCYGVGGGVGAHSYFPGLYCKKKITDLLAPRDIYVSNFRLEMGTRSYE